MPLYDYQCVGCDHTFELRQSFHDLPRATCPRCGNEARRLLRPVGIIFKGSGWYVNDYGRKTAPSSNGNGGHRDSSPSAKDATPSDGTGKETSAGSSAAPEE